MYTFHHRIKFTSALLINTLLATSLIACGGESMVNIRNLQTKPAHTPTIHRADNMVTGTLLDIDGVSPVANATLYIPNISLAKRSTISSLSLSSIEQTPLSYKNNKYQDIRYIENTCTPPPVPFVTFACTDNNGDFSLKLTSLQSLPIQVNILKADRYSSIDLSLNDIDSDLGTIMFSTQNNTTTTTSKIAIVLTPETGSDIGGRQIDTANIVEPYSSLVSAEMLDQHGIDTSTSSVEFANFELLMKDQDGDAIADINHYSAVLIAAGWKREWSRLNETSRNILLQYVENGGQLFFSKPSKQSKIEHALEEFI